MSTYMVIASLDFAERELDETARKPLMIRVAAAVEEALGDCGAEVTVAWGEAKPAAEVVEDIRRELGAQ